MIEADNIGGWILFVIICFSSALSGALLCDLFSDDYKLGYTQALADVENKVPLKYIRQEQSNKEVIWVLNEDYRKGK
jgi:hypothetical protein